MTFRQSVCLFSSLGLLAWGAAGYSDGGGGGASLDTILRRSLREHGFTGRMQANLEVRLGRKVDKRLADLGRLLWFDTITGLHDDNSCGGCHSPTAGFADTQSIAIGIDNNNLVGPHRTGPRNQRRTPSVLNAAFSPNLMWNSRFIANSGDPFDGSKGFTFPLPEGSSLSNQPTLLAAQAFIPPTERTEAAGFAFVGTNDELRAAVMERLNNVPKYRELFGKAFGKSGSTWRISYDMFARAIAEFQFGSTFANAPIDEFARGHSDALPAGMKRGAVLFFGKAKCVSCHSVKGRSNEMFSDFKTHVAGVPQVAPDVANVTFDGPGANEDFGLEQVTGDPADRYKFRSSPLRNLALQPTFFHNGAFTDLGKAIRYHIDPKKGLATYSTGNLAPDLQNPLGPMQPVMQRLDPAFKNPVRLSEREIQDLISFVKFGLLDPQANRKSFEKMIPEKLPSGRRPMEFELGG